MAEHMPDRALIFRTSTKLALQYSALYSLLVVVVVVISYFIARYEITEWALGWMQADAPSFEAILSKSGDEGLRRAIQNAADINSERSKLYGLFSPDLKYLAGNFPNLPAANLSTATYAELGLEAQENETNFTYWLRIDQVGPFLVVQGTSDEVISEVLSALVLSLVIGFLLFLALGLLLGRRVGSITEQRVAAIFRTLVSAASGNFDARINPEARGDDLWLVETKIDGTLAQLSNTVEAQKQISVDIAHDLRSPLQNVRQNVESLECNPRFEDIKAQALQAVDELSSTFQSLLEIAGLTAADGIAMQRVNVHELVDTVDALFSSDAQDAGIGFSTFVDPELEAISGDRNLLVQMIANLLENGLKYCRSGDQITLRIVLRENEVIVRVEDTGPGIPSAHHDRVFNRFHRLDTARNSPGVGLGLALVRAIAEAHGGTAEIVPTKTGTVIDIAGLTKVERETSH